MTAQDKLGEAIEWHNHHFRGKTIYEGHPLVVIDDALEKYHKIRPLLDEMVDALCDCHKYMGRGYMGDSNELFCRIEDLRLKIAKITGDDNDSK
jgi:hypothetical protein